MHITKGQESSESEYVLHRHGLSSTKHRRAASNAGPSKVTPSIPQKKFQETAPQGIYQSGVPSQLFVSQQAGPNAQLPVQTQAKSLPEIEIYASKRLKSINTLQTSLDTNLSRFNQVIDDCMRSHSKKSATSLKNELLRIIHDLGASVGSNHWKSAELIKNLEEVFYEQQSRVESLVNDKDSKFQFLTNEAHNFSKTTLKICSELGCQTASLSRKLTAFFEKMKESDFQEGSFGSAQTRERPTKPESTRATRISGPQKAPCSPPATAKTSREMGLLTYCRL